MSQGGHREGAGRPAELKSPTTITVRLEPKQLRALDRFRKRGGFASRSEAMRAALSILELQRK